MSHTLSSEADVIRCGYEVGYFDKTDIIRWADLQIEASEQPSTELLDLSMSRRTAPYDVSKLLRIIGRADPATSIENTIGFIGLLFQNQKLNLSSALNHLISLLAQPGLTSEQERQIYCLESDYYCAVHYSEGNVVEVGRNLQAFLRPVSQQLSEHYPHLIDLIRST